MSRLCFIISILIIFFSLSLFSQKVTYEFHNETLTQVLQNLNKKYHFKFAYDNDKTDKIRITQTFTEASLDDILKKILPGCGLTYSLINGAYVIVPVEKFIPNFKEEKNYVYKKIIGLVKDIQTGEHLPYASVMVVNSRGGTLTNSDGFFTVWTLSEDSVLLKVTFIGYEEEFIKIKPEAKPLIQQVGLRVQPQEMPAALITQESQQIFESDKQPGSLTLNPSKIFDIPTLAEQDIVTPMQLLPGIDGTTESSAGLIIRKSPSDKNLILYDGMTIYQIDHFFGMISSFNSKSIKDIQIYKSGFDAKFGERSSSVVEITGKSGNMTKPSVDVGIDMWSVDGMLEMPIIKEKMSLLVTGRRSYTDYYQSPLFRTLFNKTRYDLQNFYAPQAYLTAFKSDKDMPTLFFYDASAKLTYKPTHKDVFSLSGYAGSDRMNFKHLMDTLPYVKERSNMNNQGLSLRWARKWSEKYYHNFLFGVSEYAALINHTDTNLQRALNLQSTISRKNFYHVSNKIRDVNVKLHNQYELFSFLNLEFGAAVNHYKTDLYYSQTFQGDSTSYSKHDSIDKSSFLYSTYFQTVFSYKRLKSLSLGVRGSYYDFIKDYRFEPRVSALFSISPRIQAKASAGVYYQYVNRLNYQTDYRNIWTLSDGKTSPIVSSNQYMIGATFDVDPTLMIDVELYHRNTYGLPFSQIIYRKPSTTDSLYNIETELQIHYIEQKVYGMDVLLKKTMGRYQGWISYTLSKASSYSPLLNRKLIFPYNDDQLHEIKIFNTLRYNNWDFSLSFIVGSGKPWNYYKLNPVNLDYDTLVAFNSRILPLYHRMDVGAHYNIKVRNMSVKAGVDIFNVYNHRNERYALMKLRKDAGIEAAIGDDPLQQVNVYGLGFTPNFFINIRF